MMFLQSSSPQDGHARQLDLYSDEQIADWDQADALPAEERQQILQRLQAC
jgi:hypothetical protein